MSQTLEFTDLDLIDLDREVSGDSFAEFVKAAWPHMDPADYVHNWHMDAIGEHLEASVEGEITRLLINVPPGTSKSNAVSVLFPAWIWGPYGRPTNKFIGASYERGLATRDNRKTRELIESQWYRDRWPIYMKRDQNEKTAFENTMGGFRQSSSVTGMTGKRGNFVVWDDPLNPEGAGSDTDRNTANRVFSETLPSRVVNPKKSVIIVVMQRLHEEDVSGYILAGDYGYDHLMLPMEFETSRRCYTKIKPKHMESVELEGRFDTQTQRWYVDGADIPEEQKSRVEEIPLQTVYNQDPRTEEGELLFPERFPREVVDRDKKVMGTYATAGQFQQRPSPRGGGMFQKSDFEIVAAAPAGCRWVRGWDLAGSDVEPGVDPAYTAGILMGKSRDGTFYIQDMTRIQGTAGKVDKLLKNTATQDDAAYHGVMGSIPQDPGSAGKDRAKYLIKHLAGHNYRKSPESGDKVTRAESMSAQAEAGNIKIVKGEWNKEFLDEITVFPVGKFKDQVDAATRAFNILTDDKKPKVSVQGGEIFT